MTLENHVAIVTGAGQGIGRAIARGLAAQGARLALFDINEKTVMEAATEIGGSRAYVVDCTQTPAVDAAIDRVVQELGGIKILINNIGWAEARFFEEETDAYWDKLIAINLKAPLLMARAALRSMKAQGGGHIVNLASDAGRVGQLQGVVYSAWASLPLPKLWPVRCRAIRSTSIAFALGRLTRSSSRRESMTRSSWPSTESSL